MDLLQRAMPLPATVVTVAQILSALVFAALSLIPLFAYALTIGGVRLDVTTTLDLLVRLLLGALPMAGLGIAIGYGAGPNVAPALTNAVYLPMTFLSGIFIPFQILPSGIKRVGSWLPTYHYAQLAWGAIGRNDETMLTAILWLVGWGVVLFFLALRVYRLDQDKKFS
jgi:ABC-2 type transport system permease protein